MKNDISKRVEKARQQDVRARDLPDIVVKVACRYRAELYFKISRRTKLLRLFSAWTERIETMGGAGKSIDSKVNGTSKLETQNSTAAPGLPQKTSAQFIFTHRGRVLDTEQTPEEADLTDQDEILAVELMDLTEGHGTDALVRLTPNSI